MGRRGGFFRLFFTSALLFFAPLGWVRIRAFPADFQGVMDNRDVTRVSRVSGNMHNHKISHGWLAEASAVVTLLSGIVLTYVSFFLSAEGEVADSVLYYMAQCFVYAGSIFGVSVYMRRSMADIRRKLGVKE